MYLLGTVESVEGLQLQGEGLDGKSANFSSQHSSSYDSLPPAQWQAACRSQGGQKELYPIRIRDLCSDHCLLLLITGSCTPHGNHKENSHKICTKGNEKI